MVTLLGIALSAWLLPAITRQWDDRQKAHDLKASLVAQMTSETARTLEQERANLYRESVPFLRRAPKAAGSLPAELPAIQTAWAVASIRTGATIEAYFPDTGLADLWTGHRELIDALLQWLGHNERWDWQFRDESNPDLISQAAHIEVYANANATGEYPAATAQGWLKRFVHTHGKLGRFETLAQDGQLTRRQAEQAARLAKEQLSEYRSLENVLLAAEGTIASDILAAHPSGYSTTSADFFHDLLP